MVESFIDRANKKNIPVILFPIAPFVTDFIKNYANALVIATDVKQSGILQGKILVDAWNTNKEAIDKNRDNILQYVMLKGPRDDTAAIARTKYSVLTLNNAGIKTEELASQVSNWDRQLAKGAMESLFLRYDGKIEAIIANSDPMAIGAIEALQKYGYNNGDKAKTIPVVGIDGIPEARDLIKKGFMTGTVIQEPSAMAQALYTIGINLINNVDPLENTNYKFDETGVTIRIPFHEYIQQ
jgi:methyl-galactoside transport system substrate-binding protein